MLFFLLLLTGVSCFQQKSPIQKCTDPDSFPCTNGQCILKYAWCDTVEDCFDGSDEAYCFGAPCLDSHFRCRNGGCIPRSGVCDNYDDCTDGSDEAACGVHGSEVEDKTLQPRSEIAPLDSEMEQAVNKTVEYIMSKMTDENGWGDFTPRAVVALAFADKVSPMSEEKKELIKKLLNVQIMVALMQNSGKQSLSSFALYLNALYATCQDPRNFQGVDLVSALRKKTDDAMKSKFTYPISLLTLCIADEIKKEDIYKLADMYSSSDRIGYKALVIMALICSGRKTKMEATAYIENFLVDNHSLVENTDIYSKALFYQAAIAAGMNVNSEDLIKYQLADGSFGDMLATYSAVPVLLQSSLLDIKCKTSKYEEDDIKGQMKISAVKKLTYSLWIATDNEIKTHSQIIPYEGNVTFYSIMRMAAVGDPLYKFSYDDTKDGKKIYVLANIPSDAETGKAWTLYMGEADNVVVNSLQHLTEVKLGVDKIFPKDDSHFVYWYTRRTTSN